MPGGEKQLLALMRALARDMNILLLNEATSSVDGGTDALIQRIIQSQLKSVTLISIAYRLHTLAYYDRILVLDGGRVAEFDSLGIQRQDLLRLCRDASYAMQAAKNRESLFNRWTIADAWAQNGIRASKWPHLP
ncbi:uncharacterized protein IAS62_001608 [Cryptococcus decagattii]|uniref:ABC transporter domain-containing protein n=1 Tax=Cryptococcus decagattii TaxID=1859122 RepID=A0ABZ2APY5_9TREE